jgi:hypothetical protein
LDAKKRAEDEAKRKRDKELSDAALAINRSDKLEQAKKDYQEKSQKVDDLTEKLTALEAEAKVAKEETDRKSVFLERRNSPTPPSDDELAKAQKAYDQWKAKSDKLQTQLPVMRADLDQSTKDKQKASDLLDSLQKP